MMAKRQSVILFLLFVLAFGFITYHSEETLETLSGIGGETGLVVRGTSSSAVATANELDSLQSTFSSLTQEIQTLKAGQVAHDSHVSFLNDKVKDLRSQIHLLQEQINDNKAHLRVTAAAAERAARKGGGTSSIHKSATGNSGGDDDNDIDPDKIPEKPVLYSRARTDRAGATVMDMLMAHAYAHTVKGAVYGGACRSDHDLAERNKEYKYSKSPQVIEQRDRDKHTLLQTLGVEQILPYGVPCPLDKKKIAMTSDKQQYRADSDLGSVFTPEWLDFIRDNVQYPPKPKLKEGEHPIKTVAVHIRRGDVGLCKYYADRYIPNKYYLETIDEFIQEEHQKDPNARFNVTIFSEKDSSESFDEFRELGFNVHLEDDLPYVWRSMMVADILIMGRSAFSAVPALLNTHGTIVYAPYKYKPLPHWKSPKRSTIVGITPEVERLRKDGNRCKGQYHWKKRERVYDVTE